MNINRRLYSICKSGLGAEQGVPPTSATQTTQLIIHTHTHLTEMFIILPLICRSLFIYNLLNLRLSS